MQVLDNKIVVVTGGERNIGLAIVKELLAEGAAVAVAGNDLEAAGKLKEILGADQAWMFVETDVTEESSVQSMVGKVMDGFGSIDMLVTNAAIADAHNPPLEELDLEIWERTLRTNITGTFLCAKHCLPELRKNRGRMVAIASTRAFQSEPHTEAYSASKGGVVALTHALANSYGPEVRVNAVAPGWIHNGDPEELQDSHHAQHPVGRVGKPEDIAQLTAFLLSDKAGFITGQTFISDGGMTRKMIYQ